MTEFCSRCGYQLDEAMGLCPRCDRAALSSRRPKKQKKTNALPWFVILLCVCAIILALVSFFKTVSDQSKTAVTDAYPSAVTQSQT